MKKSETSMKGEYFATVQDIKPKSPRFFRRKIMSEQAQGYITKCTPEMGKNQNKCISYVNYFEGVSINLDA